MRKRRLTIARDELRNGDISVLDIAIKYGFQSHSAFTRAFKNQHGITLPQAKQLTTKLIDYLPINFSDMRFIGGKHIMAEMKKIIYKQADERLMVGMFRETSFQNVRHVWQVFFEGDFIEKLNKLSDVEQRDRLNA